MREAKAGSGEAMGLNLTGLPSGEYQVTLRAINGFGVSDPVVIDTEMSNDPTYVGAVTDDGPSLYWRLGEYDGTLVADSSGHGLQAQYTQPTTPRYHNGGLADGHDGDGAKTDSRVWYDSAYDLIRAPLATGLPTGDRTVEAWVWSNNAGARVINYGDFNVEVNERGLTVGATTLTLPPTDHRRLTDSRWHHIAV